MRHVLGVDAVEEPDAEYRISALTKGHLVHHALKRWVDELSESGAVAAPGAPWPAEARRRLLEIGAEECDRLEARGLTGRPLYWRRDRQRLLEDLETFVGFDDQMRAEAGSTPMAAELGFGQPGSDLDAVTVEIGGGRAIWLRGSIDRVDATEEEGLVVIDYKTGSDRGYKDLSPQDPSLGGRRLQLVLYAEAVRAIQGRADAPYRADAPVRADYWFVSAKGGFRARGYEVTGEVRDRVLETVGAVADGIAAGLFPLHPEPPQWRPFVPCRFCDPDGLGTRDRYNDWIRKLTDPDLRPYLAVAEPALLAALDEPADDPGNGTET